MRHRTRILPVAAFLLLASACSNTASRGAASVDGAAETGGIPAHGLLVRRSVRVPPGEYLRPSATGAIVVEGIRDATIDLAGVVLRGAPSGTDLDRCEGFGIVLRDCENVTVRGGTIGGYKGGLVAERCRGLVVDGVRFEGWYGMRLHSTTAAEDLRDWLYPHQNDEGQWLAQHGAAISLSDCDDAVIRGSRGRRGQNGILLTRCERALVYDCDFSFLSGWGLAMYRTNACTVANNVFDYCVRGYSHGVYWRGQDSAGILMFERCSDNLFAQNSATHGGDGVFLFAGRDTVEGQAFERGELDAGGSDRNIWYRNDFSFAVANAIEATFSSDNWAIENALDGSHQHGVWGGYSRRMVVLGNRIRDTIGGAVSIEHGQECAIEDNTISGNDVGVELWWDEDEGLVGGPFGRHRDTSSRAPWIARNVFAANAQDLVIKKTTGVAVVENTFSPSGRELRVERVTVEGAPEEPEPKPVSMPEPEVPADDRLGLPIGADRPETVVPLRKAENPREWLVGSDGSRPSGVVEDASLEVARREAPPWLVRARAWTPPPLPGRQDALAPGRDRRGLDTIVIGEWGPWDFRSGEPRPEPRVPGGLLADARWQAVWFSWQAGPDPRGDLEGWRALARTPIVEAEVGAWTQPWAGRKEIRAKVGSERFGLVARTRVELAESRSFLLGVLSDDGVRVRIDGRTVLENWTWHAPTRDEAQVELAAGEHEIVLEYFQIDGASALSVELE